MVCWVIEGFFCELVNCLCIQICNVVRTKEMDCLEIKLFMDIFVSGMCGDDSFGWYALLLYEGELVDYLMIYKRQNS